MMSSGTRPTASAAAPPQSTTALPRRGGRFSTLATTNNATTPMGTLTKKTHRQPVTDRISSAPESTPPMTGPSTLDVPNTARK